MSEKRCPHEEIQFCPLYVASHGTGFGCDDGRLGEDGCAVTRGMPYHREVEVLRVRCPGLVEGCEWRQALADRKARIGRNLRMDARA
jgi:hypothetical protein